MAAADAAASTAEGTPATSELSQRLQQDLGATLVHDDAPSATSRAARRLQKKRNLDVQLHRLVKQEDAISTRLLKLRFPEAPGDAPASPLDITNLSRELARIQAELLHVRRHRAAKLDKWLALDQMQIDVRFQPREGHAHSHHHHHHHGQHHSRASSTASAYQTPRTGSGTGHRHSRSTDHAAAAAAAASGAATATTTTATPPTHQPRTGSRLGATSGAGSGSHLGTPTAARNNSSGSPQPPPAAVSSMSASPPPPDDLPAEKLMRTNSTATLADQSAADRWASLFRMFREWRFHTATAEADHARDTSESPQQEIHRLRQALFLLQQRKKLSPQDAQLKEQMTVRLRHLLQHQQKSADRDVSPDASSESDPHPESASESSSGREAASAS